MSGSIENLRNAFAGESQANRRYLAFAQKAEEKGFTQVIGVPTYHHGMAVGIKDLFEEAAVKNISLKGRVGAVFGSHE